MNVNISADIAVRGGEPATGGAPVRDGVGRPQPGVRVAARGGGEPQHVAQHLPQHPAVPRGPRAATQLLRCSAAEE